MQYFSWYHETGLTPEANLGMPRYPRHLSHRYRMVLMAVTISQEPPVQSVFFNADDSPRYQNLRNANIVQTTSCAAWHCRSDLAKRYDQMKARFPHLDMMVPVFSLALIIVAQMLCLLVIHQGTAVDAPRPAKLLIGLAVTTIATAIAGVVAVILMARRRRFAERAGRPEGNGAIEFIHEHEIGELADAFSNIRDKMAAREQENHRLAYWDPLTGLPNRAQFVLLLEASIVEAEKREQSVFVLMMDLDRFKNVNDVMGHSFGDTLLRLVAQRLQLAFADGAHASAKLARLGGDEFAVLLPGTGIEQAQQMAARILTALETPLSLEDQTVDISASLGIAGYPEHADSSHTLLSMVEVAMYAAKHRKDGAVVYDAMIDGSSEKNLSLLSELRSAMERDEFRLRVQPKISLTTGQVVGFESLLRWEHPERGFLFPNEFIAFAEQTGFIRILTRWVLEQSAALCRQLVATGSDLKVSLNLSPRDLLDQDLPRKFGEILARYQLAPSSFCLEITESAIMDDPIRAQQTLERLHAMGFSLSIDDFGTGYSSLAYLKRLPVDELKIDKSFVLNMEHDIDDTKIVRSTIDLGHNLGLRVVAEGIESEAVWRLLAALGCDQGQGYFMGRPIPADQFIDWMEAWRAPTGIVSVNPTHPS